MRTLSAADCATVLRFPAPGMSRPIRSYVLRQGRVSAAQARAHEHLLPRYGLVFSGQVADWDAVFGRESAKIVEIGFGMGETTAAIAAAHPENDYLGIEVHTPGVGSLLKLIAESELANVRVVQHDAVEVVRDMLAPGVLAGIHLFFPDPWPKKRHHKRRLIKPDFVALLASRLAPGGYFHCATEWEEYAEKLNEQINERDERINELQRQLGICNKAGVDILDIVEQTRRNIDID